MQHIEKYVDEKIILYAWFSAMFTRVDVVLWTYIQSVDLKSVVTKLEQKIKEIEKIANRFDENSEISKINLMASEREIEISTFLYQAIEECIHLNSRTCGYFDITIQSDNGCKNGISNIVLNKQKQSISFSNKDVKIDLSGFIKGYALRSIKNILLEANINNALINLGNSSILAIGNHPHGIGWKVNNPDVNELECILLNQSLTTSGNSSKTKWPIVNPLTELPIELKQAVSVLNDDPAEGEALSIAIYAAHESETSDLLKEFNAQLLN